MTMCKRKVTFVLTKEDEEYQDLPILVNVHFLHQFCANLVIQVVCIQRYFG